MLLHLISLPHKDSICSRLLNAKISRPVVTQSSFSSAQEGYLSDTRIGRYLIISGI